MSYPPPPPEQPDDSGSTPPPPPPPPPPPYGSAPPPPPYGAPAGGPQGYGAPPPGYGYPAAGGYAVPGSNKKAMWSMILGILSLFCCGVVTGIAAIVLSQQAKQEIRASGGVQTGEGQAQAGLVLGIIGIAITVLGIVVFAASGNFTTS